MQPVPINLSSHTKNDTWEGVTIGPVLFNGVQPASALSSCRMYFRDTSGTIGYKLKSSPGVGEGTITISNAATWIITIPPQALTGLTVGVYEWDFETTDAAGVVRTLYRGAITITDEESYD